jgi:AmmeMemoRadiSam system protein B
MQASIRQMSVVGSFYSSSCEDIKKQFNNFDQILKNLNFDLDIHFIPKAIISPHAGYVYSGFTANIAYSLLKDIKPKRVIVIGPSHKVNFNGGSVALYEQYDTPCGAINIDLDYSKNLIQKFDFLGFLDQIHQEHSTEVQAPFIKYIFPNSSIVEIVYGNIDSENLSSVINELLKDEDNFIVISTDLSHFHNQQEAQSLDNICLKAIEKLDIDILNQGCEACGKTGVEAIIKSANLHNLNSKLLDYRTSADITKDNTNVVGYTSAVIGF